MEAHAEEAKHRVKYISQAPISAFEVNVLLDGGLKRMGYSAAGVLSVEEARWRDHGCRTSRKREPCHVDHVALYFRCRGSQYKAEKCVREREMMVLNGQRKV